MHIRRPFPIIYKCPMLWWGMSQQGAKWVAAVAENKQDHTWWQGNTELHSPATNCGLVWFPTQMSQYLGPQLSICHKICINRELWMSRVHIQWRPKVPPHPQGWCLYIKYFQIMLYIGYALLCMCTSYIVLLWHTSLINAWVPDLCL